MENDFVCFAGKCLLLREAILSFARANAGLTIIIMKRDLRHSPSELLRKLKQEPVFLTSRILYFGLHGEEERNYMIYWTMDGDKTLWNTGNILVVDNNRAAESFLEAFNVKYNCDIYFHNVKDICENKILDAYDASYL